MIDIRKLLFGDNYNDFYESIIYAAENGALPMSFRLESLKCISCDDIEKFCVNFEEATDLEMTVHIFYCQPCKNLHAIFDIDYPGDKEDDHILLQ